MSRAQRRTRAALLVLAAAVVAAAVDGAWMWRQQRWNQAIVSGPLPAQVKDAPPQVQFARAYAQAAEGNEESALNLYRSLEGDSPLGQAARYNSGNLLMRQAILVQAGPEPGKAIALIELAKEIYRDVLRDDPQHWDARYNLERAQRLLADPEEMETEPPDAKRNAERAPTTMRGYSPGLP
ncbi:MxaK protein [Variovorax sp. J22R133]|uniref:MxaK protein n=1 Tax=Variovorax brevis TaxID=3053503 RepID=UPI00257509E7|nr:MxaK protein [Variovorax sp. J22R133]MDM0111842.1 MxaK protein [Variovorax sp. J22R133]